MPLNPKFQKIKDEMIEKYGADKGEKVFYATANKEKWDVDAKSNYNQSEVSREYQDTMDDFMSGKKKEKKEGESEEKAYSFWDTKHDEADKEGKQILENGARKWFNKGFKELDEEDQQRVVTNEGYKHGEHVHYKSLVVRPSLKFEAEMKDGMVLGTSGVMIDTRPDLYNDICTKNCLKDMVNQMHERKMTMDLEHETFRGDTNASLNKATIPISKITESAYQDTGDGHGIVQIKDQLNRHNYRYNEVAGSIKDGYLTAYSIAYRPEKVSFKSVGGKQYRILDKVSLLNVTYTGVPVNPRAEIGGVQMKSNNSDNEFFLKMANGEEVDAKSVADSTGAIEAKSKDGVKMDKVEKKADEAPPKADAPPVENTAPAPANDSLENVLKEILARLAAVEAKVSENDTKPAPEQTKADAEAPAEEKKESPIEEKKEDEEPKKEDAEQKALKSDIASLKAKLAEHEKILSTPFVKGARSQMDAELKAQVSATVKKPSVLEQF